MNSKKACPAKSKRSRGFALTLIVAILAILAVGSVAFMIKNNTINTPVVSISTTTIPIVGNDKDVHGCIGSAGYSWCAVKNKCLRPWEEKCEIISATTTIATTTAKINQKIIVSGVMITPIKVIQDNRCPQGVECIMAGTVKLEAQNNSAPTSLTLEVPILINGKKITLIKVLPIKTLAAISPTDYIFEFSVANATSTSCTPKWTCGWGPCKNGYQGMTAVDSNNCGLSNTNVDIVCPALARVCTN